MNTPKEYQFVEDVLRMYRALQSVDATALRAAGLENDCARFLGFDGNHEGVYFSHVRELERRGALKGLRYEDGLNSHWPMADKYRAEFAAYRQSTNPDRLTADDVTRIMAAGELQP